jgi:anti-sigma factor RsiW
MNMSEDLEGRLLAYVDGQLDATQIAEIEAILQHDPDAAAFVHLLKAGHLSYARAFADELDEPLPEGSVDYVRNYPGKIPTR